MSQQPNITDDHPEVLQPSALEAIERAQVDVQVATAHRYPRSPELFKKRALSMATLDQETAESCIYCRPVGKDFDTGKQKFAEGASIRLAEIVAASYGNLRVGARIIEQTERFVKCEGVAHDLESNFAAKSEVVEATVKRNGQPYDERMRTVVAKAALSKALRDATFRVVPKAMCKSIYDAAKRTAAGSGKTIEQRRAAVKSWLATIHVDEPRMFAALAVKGWSEINEEQLITLTGLKTAISDGEVAIDEAFPAVANRPEGLSKPETVKAPEPPKMPQDVSGGVNTAPTPSNAAPQATAEAGKPESSTTTPPEAAPVDFVPNPSETPELQNIRYLMTRDGVTEKQVMAFCGRDDVKLATPGKQKAISDLATSKLKTLGNAWQNRLEEIRKG